MSELDPLVGTDDVLMPVVAECDDGYLNDNRATTLTQTDVHVALESAGTGPVSEGVVGAGTGTQMFDFKGGIGTASRIVEIGSRSYTVGVLLNTNYGTRQQLQIAGRPLGRHLTANMPLHHKEGSCIAVVATDLPLIRVNFDDSRDVSTSVSGAQAVSATTAPARSSSPFRPPSAFRVRRPTASWRSKYLWKASSGHRGHRST